MGILRWLWLQEGTVQCVMLMHRVTHLWCADGALFVVLLGATAS